MVLEKSKKPSKTAALIQEAATDLFAKRGFEGTIMDELAAITGVNKASIYYHFKNKHSLYETCMTALFSKVADQVELAVNQQTTVINQLERFIVAFSTVAYANPKMPAVLMREMATGGAAMPVPARQQMQRLLFCIKKILDTGHEQGVLCSVNPLTVHMIVIGSLCLYITSEPLRLAIHSDKKTDPSIKEMTAEVVRIIQGSLVHKTPIV